MNQVVVIRVLDLTSPVPGIDGLSLFIYIGNEQIAWFKTWKSVMDWIYRVQADKDCQIIIKVD